jgi:plastocyanin
MVTTRFAMAMVVFLLAISVASCSNSSSGNGTESDIKIETTGVQSTGVEHPVAMGVTWFNPPMVTIRVGDSVLFSNVDSADHSLINEELGINVAPFSGKHTLMFDKPGQFMIRHENEHAFLTVKVLPQDE